MKKRKTSKITYQSQAKPRAKTQEGVPVFCAHDEMVSIQKIVPNPGNPNTHDDQQIKLLAEIIKANGWRQPITVSTRSGFVVKGHGRRLAALAMGATDVPVDYQEYGSEAEEWADLIADNRLAELSTIDDALLVELIDKMEKEGTDVPVSLTGYSEDDIDAIIDKLEKDKPENDDGIDAMAIDSPNFPVFARHGDIWILGEHRLICGDATDPEVYKRLMVGDVASIVNTDPPYGVSYESQSGKFDVLKNDDLTDDDLKNNLLFPAFRNCVNNTEDDAAFYIWHATSTRRDFEDAMTAAGLIERQTLMWVKPQANLGRCDYHWGFEPCFYAEKAGHRAHYYGDRTQTTVWKIALRDKKNMSTMLTGGVEILDGDGHTMFVAEQAPKGKKTRKIRLEKGSSLELTNEDMSKDVWEVQRDHGAMHPTQKPVELAVRAISNSSLPGDIVLEPFCGSGSTLLGAEITGRRCRGIELDPQYIDVTVQRYYNLTKDGEAYCERAGERLSILDFLEGRKDEAIEPESLKIEVASQFIETEE